MRLNFKLTTSVLAILTLLIGCRHDVVLGPNADTPYNTGADCNKDSVYFQNDVLPILISNCAMSECHDANTAEHGVILTTYSNVIKTGGVRLGSAAHSELYKVIADGSMPEKPRNKLDANQIATIKKWIDQGARNNTCISGCDTVNVTYTKTISPIINTYCTGCHSGSVPEGNISLTNYDEVKTQAERGALYGSVSHTGNFKPMPQNSNKLSDCKINQIRIWIASGTPNN